MHFLRSFPAWPRTGSGFAALFCLLLCTTRVHAQDQIVWGSATNGLRLGLSVSLHDGWSQARAPECVIYVQNVETNRHFFEFARGEDRLAVELVAPDGSCVQRIGGDQATRLTRGTTRGTLLSGDRDVVGFFLVTNLFSLKTNGSHTLIVSGRATTNNIPERNRAYFVFPPVSNTFYVRRIAY